MKTQPFFMRFVEKQVEVETDVKAGAESGATRDRKKWWEDKGLETMKYPSDGDEELTW